MEESNVSSLSKKYSEYGLVNPYQLDLLFDTIQETKRALNAKDYKYVAIKANKLSHQCVFFKMFTLAQIAKQLENLIVFNDVLLVQKKIFDFEEQLSIEVDNLFKFSQW